jgi:hypothetical protein
MAEEGTCGSTTISQRRDYSKPTRDDTPLIGDKGDCLVCAAAEDACDEGSERTIPLIVEKSKRNHLGVSLLLYQRAENHE